jgi:hypothetical protein
VSDCLMGCLVSRLARASARKRAYTPFSGLTFVRFTYFPMNLAEGMAAIIGDG